MLHRLHGLPPALQMTIFALLGLFVVAGLASRIGGAQIRTASSFDSQLPLRVSSPAVRGISTVVHWEAPENIDGSAVYIAVRNEGRETEGETAQLQAGFAQVVVPCEAADEVTVVLRDANTAQVYGATPLSLLPPGPECL